jgi:prephenate dehydratase
MELLRAGGLRVGHLAVEGGSSQRAVDGLFASRPGPTPSLQGFGSADAVLDALQAGVIDRALLPSTPTSTGSDPSVDRQLAQRGLAVVDQATLPVDYCLAGLIGTSTFTLRTVATDARALRRCTRLLRKLNPASAEIHGDTAVAARSVADGNDPTVVALCTEDAARAAGLRILVREVSDPHAEVTRFLLIARGAEALEASPPAVPPGFARKGRCA